MSSETTMMAEHFRLQEWAAQIKECQNRPAGMSIVGWCACHGITKANYYYRLRRVREACLENLQGEMPAQQIIPVKPLLLQQEEKEDTCIQPFSVHVTKSIPMPLLAAVLEVIQDAE